MTEGAPAGNDASGVPAPDTAPIETNPNPAPAPDPTPDPAPTADPNWSQSYDTETQGWLQNRGLDKMTVQDAQTNIIKSFRNAEAKLGVPSDRRLTLPQDPTAAGAMNDVYNQLGRPKTAEEYTFKEDPDGSDKAYTDWAKTTFHGLGLSQNQAAAVYEGFTKFVHDVSDNSDKQAELDTQASMTDLKREWGGTYDHNIAVAKAAVGKLGASEEVVTKIEGIMGYAAVVKLFHKMGELTGEDVFIGSTDVVAGGGLPTTPQAAAAQIKELIADKGFRQRKVAGDVEANRQWINLHKIKSQAG